MAPRMVYFSYPIDRVPTNIGPVIAALYSRLEECKRDLMDAGVDVVYDPGDAFQMTEAAKVGPEVRSVNLEALGWADSLIAMVPSSIPSLGTPMEVAQAVSDGKAVAIITDIKSWMFGFDGADNVGLFNLDDEGFAKATIWLAAQPRMDVGPPADPLPFTVVGNPLCDVTPRKTYLSDAGFDLVVAESAYLEPGEQRDIAMGVAVELPKWAFGRITGRSSTLRKRGLLINEGIIDESYRGELFALAKNLGDAPVDIQVGERIAQLILHSNVSASLQPVRVEDLSLTERGSKGFGSTGT